MTLSRLIAAALLALPLTASAGETPSIAERFAAAGTSETPDFQKHVVPLMGRLGCNGRACHGAFSGQGGFQLSLFGYDFAKDREGLFERVDTDDPGDSYAIHKALGEEEHEGGVRMDRGSWQHRVIESWVAGGALGTDEPAVLEELVVTPSEIRFEEAGRSRPLTVVALWSDGTSEDVTALTRFQTNDDQIAVVSEDGVVEGVEAGDTHVVAFYDNGITAIPVYRAVSKATAAQYPASERFNEVDELVVAKLQKVGIVPSDRVDDATFLRRVSLDVTGTLPTPDEVRSFLSSNSPSKREAAVERLLKSPAYAAYWGNWLCDLTGNSVDKLNNSGLQAAVTATQWYDWTRDRVAENRPYDEIAEGLIMAVSRNEGESYEAFCERSSDDFRKRTVSDPTSMPWFWTRSNFKTPQERAVGFAYTFLGVRIQCAECHKHPFDVWTQDDFRDFQQFFAGVRYQNNPGKDALAMLEALDVDATKKGNQLRRQLVPLAKAGKTVPWGEVGVATGKNVRKPRNFDKLSEKQKARIQARLRNKTGRVLGGDGVNLADYDDPRQPLMDWITGPAQDLFARAMVNRVWERYFGVGIVAPADDLSLANPPSNGPLLEYLTEGFIESGYDLHWLHRTITASRTYQTDWRPNETNATDLRNFARAIIRRIPAEAAVDAVAMATAPSQRADTYRDDLTGRMIDDPLRGARVSDRNYALGVFGGSIRESNCDCDRSNDPSLLQTVYLRNDGDVLSKAKATRDTWLGETVAKWGLPLEASDASARTRPENYEERLRAAAKAILRAKQQKNTAKVKKVTRMMAQYVKRFGDLPPAADQPQDADLAGGEVRDTAVRKAVIDAYLRTLSRMPSGEERAIAVEAVAAAENPADGLKDVLWALLNTKEFIVNK